MSQRKVVVTANFQRNLDDLEGFRTEHPQGFLRALERLSGEVLPMLRRRVHVGRLFDRGQLTLTPLLERIKQRLGGGVIREQLVGEYLLLYLVSEKQIALMAIRHQRELGSDFGD